ncbi:MAG TPA: hypothetical protein VFG22_01975 [Polyangiales bacterium]|nr:hypothetical protein [Polyangiales bacterium]
MRCPYCTSVQVEGEAVAVFTAGTEQTCTCTRCAGTWTDVYAWTHVVRTHIPSLAPRRADSIQCPACLSTNITAFDSITQRYTVADDRTDVLMLNYAGTCDDSASEVWLECDDCHEEWPIPSNIEVDYT